MHHITNPGAMNSLRDTAKTYCSNSIFFILISKKNFGFTFWFSCSQTDLSVHFKCNFIYMLYLNNFIIVMGHEVAIIVHYIDRIGTDIYYKSYINWLNHLIELTVLCVSRVTDNHRCWLKINFIQDYTFIIVLSSK